MRGELPRPSLSAGGLGIVTSVLILIGFALPPLLQLRFVPPARVLRRNLEPPPLRYVTVYGTAARRAGRIAGVAGSRCAAVAVCVRRDASRRSPVLMLAGWLLVRALSGLRGSVGVSWRYGMANIARRGRDSVIQIVAFGLGIDGVAAARGRSQRPHAGMEAPACRRTRPIIS